MSGTETPLFPLRFVLCPGGPLPLRIFEPRYLDMVGRCLKSNSGFGVVAIRSGSEVGAAETYDVGTLAEIVDWFQDESGLLGVTAMGRERFRIQSSRRQSDGLYVGEVETLPAEPRVPVPEEHRRIADLLRKLLERAGSRYRTIETDFDDSAWVGHRFIEILPLELDVKQSLLEMNDPVARLGRLLPLMKQAGNDGSEE